MQGSGHGYCRVWHRGGNAGSATPSPAPAHHLWMEASVKLNGQVHEVQMIFLTVFIITAMSSLLMMFRIGLLLLWKLKKKAFVRVLKLLPNIEISIKPRYNFFAKMLLPYVAFWMCNFKVIRGFLAVFSSSESPLKGANGFAELVRNFIEAEISLNLNFWTRRQW